MEPVTFAELPVGQRFTFLKGNGTTHTKITDKQYVPEDDTEPSAHVFSDTLVVPQD